MANENSPRRRTAGDGEEPVEAVEDVSYAVEQIHAEPEGFGFEPHILAGALTGMGPEERLTKAQVNDRVQQWLARPVA